MSMRDLSFDPFKPSASNKQHLKTGQFNRISVLIFQVAARLSTECRSTSAPMNPKLTGTVRIEKLDWF